MNITNLFRDRVGLPARTTEAAGNSTFTTVPAVSTEATAERPYYSRDGSQAFPGREIFSDIYRRAEQPSITPEQKKSLLRIQKRIEKLDSTLKNLTFDAISRAEREAKDRLRRGKGSTTDAWFEKRDLRMVREATKKELNKAEDDARPILTKIGKEIERLARLALPQVEAEAAKLRIPPQQVPVVVEIGKACWMPSTLAIQNPIGTPKRWLKQVGIKL